MLLGIAMGCLGMSMDDFCRCTPSEFKSVHDAWDRAEERRMRDSWEQVRIMRLSVLQPWSKKRLDPHEVLPLPWDGEPEVAEEGAEELTDEERKARYEAAKRRYGIGG